MSRCRELERLSKEHSLRQIELRRALEEDPARYLVLWFEFHREEYEMRALVHWAPRRMGRSARLLGLPKADLQEVVGAVGSGAAAVCFYMDCGIDALLDLAHHRADLSATNHYHVLHFALHYKDEAALRRLLEFGYSPLVLDAPLLRVALQREYCLQFLFREHWNHRLQRPAHFCLERVLPALAPAERDRLAAAQRDYCRATFGMEQEPLALAIVWTAAARRRAPLFDDNVFSIVRQLLW